MATPIKAIGIQFKINSTTIAEVLDFEGPGIENELIETTSHSTSGGYKTYITGTKDNAEIKFDISYVPTESTHNASTGLLKFADSGEAVTWAVVWPDAGGTTWSGNGLVMSFTPKAAIEDQLMAEVTVKPTGAPTLV
jgi:predicted secreted protein